MKTQGCWIIALVTLLAGCGGGEAENFGVAPAGGKVSFQGKPVTGASIMFAPTAAAEAKDTKIGKAASGALDANGEFTLSTYEQGDGAVVGKHKVILSEEDPNMPLPGKLKDGLELEVKAGETNRFEIELEPGPAKR